MKLLIDTHALIWFLEGSSSFSAKARRRIEDETNEKYVSVASIWEMAIKISIGKLRLDFALPDLVRASAEERIQVLSLEPAHAFAVTSLRRGRNDPFDRLLAAQALVEEMAVVSRDESFDAHRVRRIW